MAVMAARQDFIDAALSMGWQLALTILIPVFIGAQIDKKFDTAPSYTLTALFLAVGLGGYVVAQAIKKVTAKQESRRGKKTT
jgi:F0F1-type ATP synthase assembly protein I